MPIHRLAASSVLVIAFGITAGCGSLSGDTGSPSTLVTIHGTITSDAASAATPSLSTAIVWFQTSQDGTVRETAAGVPVSGSFPASFAIDVTALPPASAMTDLGGRSGDSAAAGVHFAWGYVVAYDDRNGNGRLDLVDASASQYADAIEGVADQLVFYLDRPIPAAFFETSAYLEMGLDGSTPRAGYNLFQPKPNYCFADAEAGAAGRCTSGVLWEATDAAVTLPLRTPPAMSAEVEQELMCSAGPNAAASLDQDCGSGPCPPTISVADFPGALPSAGDPNVFCTDLDDFQYTSSCATSVAGVCQTVDTVCTQQTIVTLDPAGGPPSAPPAGWPCAAQPAPSPAFLSSFAGRPNAATGGEASAPSPADAGPSST